MIADIGSMLIGLALAVACYTACAAFWAVYRSDARWAASARNGTYVATGLLGFALLLLLVAFLNDDFRIRYVAQHSSLTLPLYLKVSSVWAGQEGSLLLWAFLQALFTGLVVGRPTERTRDLIPWATVLLSIITGFFAAVTLFLSNPFAPLDAVPFDGQGLNPLLRHPGMIFHPPAMYLGYVGLAVPFAFALAALITRRIADWPAAARRWTLSAWLFLGVGLLLGARWAYDVLGWGGYWGWDPVENAGLMPWLTTTALLHSAVMQGERRGFRGWNLMLAVFSFTLVLFGTFTTRSGLIQSVHAFARSNLGPYFLAAIGLTVGGSLALIYARRSLLADAPPLEKLLSRDGMFFLTLLLFVTITLSVFVGSVLPTLTSAFSSQQFEAGPQWFDRVTGPQFAALVLLMGVCPLLGRATAALRRLRERGLLAVLGAILVVIAAALAGFTDPLPMIGFFVVGLAGATTLAEYGWNAATRSRNTGEHLFLALWRLFGRNRRKYGGYLVHVGVILMGLGVIGTRMYPFETEVVLTPGEPVTVGEYTLVYEELERETLSDHVRTWASLAVSRGQDDVTTLYPRLDQYMGFEQTISLPALRAGPKEDLYVVLAGWQGGGATATFKVFINALASFLWLGGLIFLMGGLLAVWPSARAARLPVPQARRRTIGIAVGVVVGGLVLIAAFVAMWGGGTGIAAEAPSAPDPASSESEPVGRVSIGEPSPDFTLPLLDGSTTSLSALRGQVVILNFWATWCPPCEDELPDLQAVWEQYQDQDVTLVGIAFQEEQADVQAMASRFGLTYPLGIDEGDRIAAAFGITGVPETFVVDAQGQVAYIHIGPVTAVQLSQELDSLLSDS